ncbi:MAG: hypothetical protein ACM3VT_20015 [Solirubrobacterales bacterium]
MIENVQNSSVTRMVGTNTAPNTDVANRPTVDDSDATLQVNFADMVNRALQTTETETDAVARAKELLQTNRLITPENIRSAAENILTFGI